MKIKEKVLKDKKGLVNCGLISFTTLSIILYSVFLLTLGFIIGIILK